MPSFFISATGTDCGKTYLTAHLAAYWHQQNHKVFCHKPIISGLNSMVWEENDLFRLQQATGNIITQDALADYAPWHYQNPLSPDMAARLEGKPVDTEALIEWCQSKMQVFPDAIHLFEGAGGLMVPLNDQYHTLDWLTRLKIPLILVIGSYLGSLSHCLTAYNCAKNADIPIVAIIVNQIGAPAIALDDTIKSLGHFIEEPLIPLHYNPEQTGDIAIIAHQLQQYWGI